MREDSEEESVMTIETLELCWAIGIVAWLALGIGYCNDVEGGLYDA